MAGEIFTLYAKLGIKDDEFNKGISNASKKGSGLANTLKTAFKVSAAAVGVTTAAVVGLSKKFYSEAKETADYGDKVDKMSQKIGISAEAYQKWDYVMQRAGGNVDSLKMGMKTLSQQAEKNSDAFQKLGISQEEVASLSKEDLFTKTVQGLSEMKDGTERTALATQLLGRAGADMGPLLNQGSDAIKEQMEIAEKYGMGMSDKAVKASAAFNDSLTTLSMTAQGLKNRLMGEFLPALTEVTDGLANIFAGDYDKGVEQITQGISDLTTQITESLPTILNIGADIVLSIGNSIVENLPSILDTALQVVLKLGEGIISNLPTILQTGLQVILSLAQGLTQAIPSLMPAITQVIIELAKMLTEPDMLNQMIDASIALELAFMDGLIQAIPQLLEAVPVIIKNLLSALIKAAPKLLKAGGAMVQRMGQGITNSLRIVSGWGATIFNRIRSAITDKISSAWNWGADLMSNFASGLRSGIDAVVGWVSHLAEKIAAFLHFSEPDEGPLSNFHTFAPDMIDLWNKGIKDNEWKVAATVDGLAQTMAGGFDDGFGYEETEQVQRIELTFADNGRGNIGMQLARLLAPYMRVVDKEQGYA